MKLAVLVMRMDGSKQFFPGCHIAGYWDGDLILSTGEQGVGMSVSVHCREPVAGLKRVEVVAADSEEDEESQWARLGIGSHRTRPLE